MNNPLRGRNPNTPYVKSVRPMTIADLEHLRNKSAQPRIQKLREAHHHVARLLASGLTQTETARQIGYSANRIHILANTPAVQELIAKYRAMDDQSWKEARDEVNDSIYSAMTKSWRMINERLDKAEEANEELPLQRLLAIADSGADRVGYHKKSASINVNMDFAMKLESAIARSRTVRPTIELERQLDD